MNKIKHFSDTSISKRLKITSDLLRQWLYTSYINFEQEVLWKKKQKTIIYKTKKAPQVRINEEVLRFLELVMEGMWNCI